MAVLYRQTVDGEVTDERPIEPHRPDQSDEELLRAKASGAEDKGWAVTWTGARSFTARKTRWAGSECVRDFWTE